ncbi:MAG: Rrf2 family transcriptional regulator [Planctomycetota bacterium]|nr:Rrf2 family transcriptional regulator [Planctomycetota bacterium]
MRYTQSTEWALDSLFFIAAHGDRQDFSVEEIAKAQQVSPSYLAKIFQQLTKAGILRSHRGAKGGYSLGRLPEQITLLDVATVCEGSIPLYDCNAPAKSCSLGAKCLILSTFREAERRMQETLNGVTLQDLVESMRRNMSQATWLGVEGAPAGRPAEASAPARKN